MLHYQDMAYGYPSSRFYIMRTLYKLPASITPSDPFGTYASPQHPVRPQGAPRLPPPQMKKAAKK